MTVDEVKNMMEGMGWKILKPTDFEHDMEEIEKGVEKVSNQIDAISEHIEKCYGSTSAFIADPYYPRQYPKGNFPQHYPKAKSTPPKNKVDPMFQEREKSDAGKLADKFTEFLKKK
jgi:hypothetical protein